MTISTARAKAVHVTDEKIKDYGFDFKVFKATEIAVNLVDPAGGGPELLTLGEDFSVSGLEENTGGVVHLTDSAANRAGRGRRLVILRNMPFVQDVDYRPHDIFPAETHERALDIAAMERQELREKLARAVLAPPDKDTAASYEEIIAMKEGPAGPMGPQGPAGLPGAPGPEGPEGPPGRAPALDVIDCGGPAEEWVVIVDGGLEQ